MKRNVLFIVCILAAICIVAIFTIQNRKEPILLREFKEKHPDSSIVDYAMMYIDDEGEDDIVILFKDETLSNKNTNVNIAFITQDTASAFVALYANDPEYEFANHKNILKVQKSPKKVNILIINTATNEILDNYVEINYDKENLSLDLVTGIE